MNDTALFSAGFVRLSKWLKVVGISRTTAWRLRKSGKLKTFTRHGHTFITEEAAREFEEPCALCSTPDACEALGACNKSL